MADLLSAPTPRPARLRTLLATPGPLVAPGAYDALSARLVEQAGFDVVYMTGFGSTASLIGRPDVGLLTGTEMVDNARRIAAAIDLPVIADADTGYGNAINVVRTVQAYEQAGVAGMHLEDQVMPKKCGHMSGKAVIPAEEMVGKIRAAGAARRDPDFVLIARTDAVAVEGVAAAIARARAYAEAGADALFVEAPTSEDDIARVAAELRGVAPLVFNWAVAASSVPIGNSASAKPSSAMRASGIGGVRPPSAQLNTSGATPASSRPIVAMSSSLVGASTNNASAPASA